MQGSDVDFIKLRPKWNRQWEYSEDKLTVILIPKFGDHRLGKWFMSRMNRPHYRLKLDEIGSYVWEQCNGKDSVQNIGEKLSKKFGTHVEPVYDRLRLFFQSLEKSKSITWV